MSYDAPKRTFDSCQTSDFPSRALLTSTNYNLKSLIATSIVNSFCTTLYGKNPTRAEYIVVLKASLFFLYR